VNRCTQHSCYVFFLCALWKQFRKHINNCALYLQKHSLGKMNTQKMILFVSTFKLNKLQSEFDIYIDSCVLCLVKGF
jgi:hypothetical protein